MTARERILASLTELGDDELAVLAEVAAGLVAGRGTYGELHLASDRRDFEREALDEVRDALVYLGAAIVHRQRSGR